MNHTDHHYDNAINNNANNKQSTLNINDLDDDNGKTLNKYNSHKLTNKILKKSKQRKSKWSTKMNDRINLNDDDDNNELCNEIVCNWNVEYCSIIDSTKAECVKKKKNKNRMINRKYSNLHYSNDDDDDSSSGDDESDDSNSSDDHSSSGYDDDFPYKIMHKSNQFKSNGIIIDDNNNKIKLFSNSKQQQQQQQNNGKYNNKNNYESTLANNNNNNNRWKMIQSNQINAIKHQFNVLGNNNHHQANNNRMKKLTYEQRNQRKLQNHQGQQPKQQQQQKNESTLKKHQNNDNDDDRHNKTIGCPSCNTISHNSNQQIICGTDNSTYSSMCRIDYHNCIHRKDVRFACFGFCPCSKLIHGPDSINNNHHQRMPMKASSTTATTTTMTTTSKIESKIRSNPINKDHNNNVEISLHLKLKNSTTNDTKKLNKQQQHYYYYHYDHMDNQTSHDHSNYSLINSNNNNNKCSSDELRSMGDRLLDWFTVVMQEELSRLAKSNNNENRTATLQQYNNTLTNSNKYLPDCDESVSFMFYHFDIDHNYKLTTNELYYLEHDENEHCLEPYLIQCDEDSNHLLTVYEWCSCFSLRSKPCLYHQKHLIQQQSNNNSKQNNANNNIEQFLPQCDENGHYRSVQCQSQSNKKFCWCSDKNGNEIAGTRVFGRMPICDKSYPLKRYYMNNNNNNQKQSKSINDLNRRESMINHKQYSKFYINNIKQSSSYNSWKYKDIDDDDDDDDDYGDNNNGNIVYNNEDDEDFNGQYDNHNKDIDDDDQDDDDSFQMDHGSGHLETF